MDNPLKGFELLFSNGTYNEDTYKYASQIWYFRDAQSFSLIRFASLFDLITFSSYSGTAVLFAVTAFASAWLLFITFYGRYFRIHKWLAFACLFVPTVFFWGSGIFKDTLTLAALSVSTYSAFKIFGEKKVTAGNILIILLCLWVIYSIKVYILLCFLPAIIMWVFVRYLSFIKSLMAKLILSPFVLIAVFFLGYQAIQRIAADDPRYNLSKLSQTAQITAYDIRYWTGKDAGSGYSLGELDGSFESMIRLAPQAVNVSLFRPYLWEVRNPLMLLSALESLALLILTVYFVVKSRFRLLRHLSQPDVVLCLFFSLVFAFAVGVSTFNFGTLSRYKIPLMPFYLIALGLIHYYSNKERKFEELEATEN